MFGKIDVGNIYTVVTDICVHVGPVTVGFEARTMTVAEDAGTIQVEVTLQQNVAVRVTVDITAVSETAVEQKGQYIMGQVDYREEIELKY